MRRGVDTRVRVPGLLGMTVVNKQGPKLRYGRKMFVLRGMSSPCDMVVHNNSLVNLTRALAERVLYSVNAAGQYVDKLRPRPRVIRRCLRYFSESVKQKCVVPPKVPLDKVPELYNGRKRTQAQQAVESLMIEPIKKQDARTKPFVKGNEKQEIFNLNMERVSDKVPRVIQCRTPRYVVSCAQWLKRLEKPIYKAIERIWDEVTVAKGLNADETGKLIYDKFCKYSTCAAVGLDASKFDKHVSVEMLQWEHSVYGTLYNHDPELMQLLSWQLRNGGTGRTPEGLVKYSVDGCRMSGDINTSLGNCLIMCAMVHAYAREVGVKCSLINNGDDCVVFMEKSDVPRFSIGLDAWFEDMGFIMVAEAPVYDVERVVFCQTQPVWVDGAFRMVRNPRMAAAKDCRTVVDISSNKAARKWAQAVGDCGAALCDGIPCSRAYYACMQRFGGGLESRISHATGMESGMDFMARRMEDKGRYISAETRYSFWLAFGIVPDLQRAIETYYNAYNIGYCDPVPIDESTNSLFLGSPTSLWVY